MQLLYGALILFQREALQHALVNQAKKKRPTTHNLLFLESGEKWVLLNFRSLWRRTMQASKPPPLSVEADKEEEKEEEEEGGLLSSLGPFQAASLSHYPLVPSRGCPSTIKP